MHRAVLHIPEFDCPNVVSVRLQTTIARVLSLKLIYFIFFKTFLRLV